MAPILAIFAAKDLPGGSIEVAGFAYSIHLIVRVVFELMSGKFLAGSSSRKKIYVTILGIIIVTISYLYLAMTENVLHFYIAMGITGMGFGIISPAKNALFSTHLDKDKESMEWGMSDATVFVAIALASSLGGLMASKYGFKSVFLLAACVNILACFPYLLYLMTKKRSILPPLINP